MPRDDVDVQVGHALAHPVVGGHERAVSAETDFEGVGNLADPLEKWSDLGRGQVDDGLPVGPRHHQDVSLEDRAPVEKGHGHSIVEHDLSGIDARDDGAETAGGQVQPFPAATCRASSI